MKRAWIPIAIALVALILLRVLLVLSIVHQLLGAARPSVIAALLLLVFYGFRFVTYFVVPGWLAYAAITRLLDSQRFSAGRWR